MVTQYFLVSDQPSSIDCAADVIRRGGLVAFPTETVYGLGANALDANAVAGIYIAKQRALNDPLIVHCALNETELTAPVQTLASQQVIGDLTERQHMLAGTLIQRCWPGPLTLILPRGQRIPAIVSAGLDTVAVRMPNHPVALALIRRSGVPIAAPSANRFGHVSPTTARHVLDDLEGRIDVVLDGGSTPIGVESTVLDLTHEQPAILRPGGTAREEIEQIIGPVSLWRDSRATVEHEVPPSPGLLDKHYAPHASLRIVPDTTELLRLHAYYSAQGLHVGLLILESQREPCADLMPQFVLGEDAASIARNLYAGLRALDSTGVDVILVSEIAETGLGAAIVDRLKRGSTHRR